MAGIITSGNWGKALWPGINAFWGQYYNVSPPEWTKMFSVFTSRKQFEEDVGTTTLGLATTIGEGQAVSYDSDAQSYLTRYTHVTYGLGFIITRIMVEDDLYDVAAQKRTRMLAFSMEQTKERIAANVYNNLFSDTGGDGVSGINASHPLKAGGTQSNTLSTAANLSEAALEQARIDIKRFKNDRGHFIQVMPETLILPPELEFEATRILKTSGPNRSRVGTANNDVNALNLMGEYSDMVINRFLSSTTAWFIRTDVQDGMKHFVRRAMEFTMDNDFDTDNAKYKATERFSFGYSDWRGIYGTAGV
jgi:Mu-like prophage major head subunit gpT